jgi:eukaryotic-like serine/threonine-protein kinase
MDPGPDPLLGKTIQDRYRIEKKLGQGGMGAVYLAEHVLIHKRVAIKCLHAGLASNPEVVRRFHNEALAATAIGHPNIVDVTDMGYFPDGSVFMVLEFLEGRDWQDDLEASGPQDPMKVAHIGIQVAEALAAAGEKGIVHRDLKPENVFLIERQGDPNFVKVLDFGISKFKDGLTGGTQTGQLMGTPYYMAPEQIRGAREITHHADLYSTGVMFYRALAGALPFEAQSLPELVLKIATESPVSVGVRRPDLPPRLVQLVDRMLLKDPRERPKNFDEVADALAEFDSTALRRKRHRVNVALLSTDYGGSLGEPGLGELPPERRRLPTPVHERGPDTAAQGSPIAYVASTPVPRLMPDPAQVAPSTTAGFSKPPSDVPGVPKSRSLLGPILAVSGLVIVAGAALVFLNSGQDPPRAAPDAASTNTLEASTAKKVRVQISTIPPDAEVTLDEKPISNPFDGELAEDEARHLLRVTRDGFEPSERSLFFRSEQRIFVQLNQKAAETPPVVPDPRAGEPAPRTGTGKPNSTPPKTVPVAPEPAPTQVVERVVERVIEKPADPPPATPEKKSPLKKVF